AGLKRGDVIAVMLPQCAALVVAHLGALKLGCAVVPLAEDSSAREVEHAISDSRAKAIVLSTESCAGMDSISNLKLLEAIFVAGELDEDLPERNFWREVYAASSDFTIAETRGETPAFIFSEDDAGFIHGHSLLIGSLPAFEMINDFDLADDAVFYTRLNWSSAESLFGLLYPAWFYGLAVVACQQDSAMAAAERYRVTNLLVSSSEEDMEKPRGLRLRSIYSINESLPRWAKAMGASAASAYGVRGAPMIAASCERWFSTPAGSRGRAAVGHRVEVIDESGRPLQPGKPGRIVVRRPDPSLFLSRCGDTKSADEWHTLARGLRGEDGSLWFATVDERSP
ncbi:MAG: AMP-binding protein, partial [Acidobacteriota bacterium]